MGERVWGDYYLCNSKMEINQKEGEEEGRQSKGVYLILIKGILFNRKTLFIF
jgi:hypothetical protein